MGYPIYEAFKMEIIIHKKLPKYEEYVCSGGWFS